MRILSSRLLSVAKFLQMSQPYAGAAVLSLTVKRRIHAFSQNSLRCNFGMGVRIDFSSAQQLLAQQMLNLGHAVL